MVVRHIAFRTDVSNQIGTGHFMRCLTLADELKQCGARTRFVSRYLPEYFYSMLSAKGHEIVLHDSIKNNTTLDELAHANWLKVSQAQDATDTIQVLSDETWDWLIVDHYALDSRWELMLRKTAKKILVIDDIADRQHDCDILIDQNLYAEMEARYAGKVSTHCRLLLGPQYAILRDDFRRLHMKIKPRSEAVKRILVFFGGVDKDNFTGIAIEALSKIDISVIDIDVVIGAQHPNSEQIKSLCDQNGFVCHIQTNKMAELMSKADLAIGAGGSASWERCSLGLPALLVATADNQIDIAQALDSYGACIYLGTSLETSVSTLRNRIINLLGETDQIYTLSRNAYSLVDGLGIRRIRQAMSC